MAVSLLNIPVSQAQYFHITAGSTRTLANEVIYVPVLLASDAGAPTINALDLKIAYNGEVLTNGTATIGSALHACGWTEFRAERPDGVPGMMRIQARCDSSAEMSGNPNGVIAWLVFRVTNDRTVACQSPGLRFCWQTARDNSLTAADGTRFIVGAEAGGIRGVSGSQLLCAPWDHVGYHASVLCGAGRGTGAQVEERVGFQNGQVGVICPDERDIAP